MIGYVVDSCLGTFAMNGFPSNAIKSHPLYFYFLIFSKLGINIQ